MIVLVWAIISRYCLANAKCRDRQTKIGATLRGLEVHLLLWLRTELKMLYGFPRTWWVMQKKCIEGEGGDKEHIEKERKCSHSFSLFLSGSFYFFIFYFLFLILLWIIECASRMGRIYCFVLFWGSDQQRQCVSHMNRQTRLSCVWIRTRKS